MPRILIAALVLFWFSPPAAAQVVVVASSPSLADIARNIGGEHVTVEEIMRGPENPHNVIPKPSYIMRVRRADLFLHRGLDAEPWVPLLVKSARKPHLLFGEQGNVDVSRGIALLEVPRRGSLSRANGDIHVYGNTHYGLDPLNGILIARNIANALGKKDPEHAETYRENLETYSERLRELSHRLILAMSPYQGTPVVTYHRTWPYFLKHLGLIKVAEVEPKPGITPGPRSLAACVETMKATGAKVIIVETYNNKSNADFVAELADGIAVVLAQEVKALPEVDTYEKLFEHNVKLLLQAFKDTGVDGHN